MSLVIIFGPPAVGKMTVGYELQKITGMRLYHNHMSIEPVLNFFDWGDPRFGKLVGEFRKRIFEEVAQSDLPGLVFTYVWAFDQPRDKLFIDESTEIFARCGRRSYFVELEAGLEKRLARNKTEFRLERKPSKRDLVKSEKILLEHEVKHSMNSKPGFFSDYNYIKINNDELLPDEVASEIVSRFNF